MEKLTSIHTTLFENQTQFAKYYFFCTIHRALSFHHLQKGLQGFSPCRMDVSQQGCLIKVHSQREQSKLKLVQISPCNTGVNSFSDYSI